MEREPWLLLLLLLLLRRGFGCSGEERSFEEVCACVLVRLVRRGALRSNNLSMLQIKKECKNGGQATLREKRELDEPFPCGLRNPAAAQMVRPGSADSGARAKKNKDLEKRGLVAQDSLGLGTTAELRSQQIEEERCTAAWYRLCLSVAMWTRYTAVLAANAVAGATQRD